MSITPVAPSGDSGDAVRQLPHKPSLEFERKRAKALLRRLRRVDVDATLADAQFTVARELGFSNWPRLVQYFHALEREAHAVRRVESFDPASYDGRVRTVLAEHRYGRVWVGRSLAAYVPRFYGMSIDDVLAATVTLDDARLVVARQNGCYSWDQLLEEAARLREREGDPWTRPSAPFMRALRAMREHDVGALEAICTEHPELLHPSEDDEQRAYTLMYNALILERREHTPEARRVTDWLVSRGMPLTRALNQLLLGHHGTTVVEAQYLLDRGADPRWVAPNGVSVLEHAILRCWNGAVVDLIARHAAVRRPALWIAAGLGDVAGVGRYFDRAGKLTAAARTSRPPFELMGRHSMPSVPEPDELELLAEVVIVAAMNERTEVLELFIDRGFPVDYDGWGGTSLLRFAIGQRNVAMLEMLLRRGADLDKKGEWPHQSAREFAREMVGRVADTSEMRTILALCGAGTPEDVRAARDRQRPSPPPIAAWLQEALDLAGDDAARRGQTEIGGENLFIGLLRGLPLPLGLLAHAGVDLERLRTAVVDRVHPAAERVERSKLPLDAAARAFVARAVALADERRYDTTNAAQLLEALVEREPSQITDLVVACGGNLTRLRQQLLRA